MSKLNNKSGSSLLLVLGIILIASNLRAPMTAVGPLLGTISESYHLSSGTAGMIATTPLLAFAVTSILAPKNAAKFGLEKTLFVSLIVLGIGLYIRSLPSVTALFVGTILMGIGIAHGNVLVPSLIKRDFPAKKIGMMTGIFSVSMTLVGAFASGVSLPLVQNLGLSWQGSLRVWLIFAILAILVWLPQLKNQTVVQQQAVAATDKNFVKSPLAWYISLFMGLQSLFFYSLLAWLPQIFMDKGMTGATAGWLLAFMQLFIVPLNFIIALVAGNRRDQRSLVIMGCGLFFTGLLGLLFSDSIWVNAIACAAIGSGGGFCFSLAMIFFSVRTETVHEAGRISGMAQSLGYLLAAVGPFFFGWLHDQTGGWTGSLVFLVILTAGLLFVGLKAGQDTKI